MVGLLTCVMPVSRCSITAKARDRSRVKTLPVRPKRTLLAASMAWSTVSTRMTLRTGPKISSVAMRASLSTRSKTVGSGK